jgi:hypothetical protein
MSDINDIVDGLPADGVLPPSTGTETNGIPEESGTVHKRTYCEHCNSFFDYELVTVPRKYCSDACTNAAERSRKSADQLLIDEYLAANPRINW